MAHDFTITFRGVRGSIPVPGPTTLKIGGNSSCVQVNVLDHTIFLDAGTGIVSAGQQMVRNFFANRDKMKRLTTTILISHTHHDHIMGLPFFPPLYIGDSSLSIFGPSVYGPVDSKTGLEYVLEMMMDQMFFPVDLKETNSIKKIATLKPFDQILLAEGGEAELVNLQTDFKSTFKDKVIVSQYRAYNHPKNGTLVYKLQYAGKSVVYATDIESYAAGDRRLIQFAKGADLLIHDAQYTMEQYTGPVPTQGFGHSTPEMACFVAKEAGVKQLVLYHHDPNHDDAFIERKEEDAKNLFTNTICAYEGLTIPV
ncbi:MAG TPA: MBL fold metallo-hydrolase [bacterium]|jgi:ribonuclease BN (tRNA processing enzyme)|nr:MBL fold metallo-hydrolase [bacterium]